MVPEADAIAMMGCDGANAILGTRSAAIERYSFQSFVVQICTPPALRLVANQRPSGLKMTDELQGTSSSRMSRLVLVSQIRTLRPFCVPVATTFPSGLMATYAADSW